MRNLLIKFEIPPERMAVIVEDGLAKLQLSRKEIAYLHGEGFDELHQIHTLVAEEIPDIDDDLFERILSRCHVDEKPSPFDMVLVKIKQTTLALIADPMVWRGGSPAFSVRDDSVTPLVFHRNIDGYIIDFQLQRNSDPTITMSVVITPPAKIHDDYYTIELLSGDRCVENLKALYGRIAQFNRIPIDEYRIRIATAHETIVAFPLRIQQSA